MIRYNPNRFPQCPGKSGRDRHKLDIVVISYPARLAIAAEEAIGKKSIEAIYLARATSSFKKVIDERNVHMNYRGEQEARLIAQAKARDSKSTVGATVTTTTTTTTALTTTTTQKPPASTVPTSPPHH